MEGNYEVQFGEKCVGRVVVKKDGLYYRFSCRCQLTGDVVCRVRVSSDGIEESLGILVPMGNGFGLETKIAAKRLGKGEPKFHLVPNRIANQGQFVPIYPEEPFAYIAKLKNAFLARQDGHVGIIIKEQGT